MARRRGRRKKPFRLKLRKDLIYSLSALLFSFLSLLIFLSLTRQGVFLTAIYNYLSPLFGWTLLMLPFLLLSLALVMTQLKLAIASLNTFLGGFLIFLSLLTLTKAGAVGQALFLNLAVVLTPVGASLSLIFLFLAGLMILTNTPLAEFLLWLINFKNFLSKLSFPHFQIKSNQSLSSAQPKIKLNHLSPEDQALSSQPKLNLSSSSPQSQSQKPKDKDATKPDTSKEDFTTQLTSSKTGETLVWQYPPLNLLQDYKNAKADMGDFKANAQIIESTLNSFNIRARVVEINGGPSVTQYAIKVAEGTRLAKIKALQNDLALALAAPNGRIRIEAPIPGRPLVGIEIPNRSPEIVSLKRVLSSPEMKKAKSKLTVGLGLGVAGNVVTADIAKMPHLLIAGATNSGKSVCINTIISTLLFRNSPEELRFILVDPKRVELTPYNGIPHLLTPVIHDADRVIAALQWAVKKMDERYRIFQEVGARNIAEYNQLSGFTAMEYIVIVIDELAEIMLFAPSKVEELIIRLAQLARAVGIHLVLATQRPTVNVITGLIKANIPARIAFNVTSMVDSKVIIDSPGAEKLLGKGDMLFIPPDQAMPTRIQGTFVSTQEIKNLTEFLKQQAQTETQYEEEVTEKYKPDLQATSGSSGSGSAQDPLFTEAIKIVINNQKASTSFLQRKLSIGYNRAARIMDQLESAGIVSPPQGSKPRTILISSFEDWQARQSS